MAQGQELLQQMVSSPKSFPLGSPTFQLLPGSQSQSSPLSYKAQAIGSTSSSDFSSPALGPPLKGSSDSL